MPMTPACSASPAPEPRTGARPKARTEFAAGPSPAVAVLPTRVALPKSANSSAPNAAATCRQFETRARLRARMPRSPATRSPEGSMGAGVSVPDVATTQALTISVSAIDVLTLALLTFAVFTLDGPASTPDVVAPTLVAVAASTATLLAY